MANARFRSTLIAASALVFCVFAEAAQSSVSKIDVTIESSVFASKALGFSYPIPPSYSPNAESGQQFPAKSRLLMMSDAHTGRPFRNRIVLLVDDASEYQLSLHDYAAKVGVALSHQSGRVLVRENSETHFGGKLFFRTDFNLNESGEVLYQSLLCTERRGFWISWTFVAGSAAELEQMITSLADIKFIDEPRDLNAVAKRT